MLRSSQIRFFHLGDSKVCAILACAVHISPWSSVGSRGGKRWGCEGLVGCVQHRRSCWRARVQWVLYKHLHPGLQTRSKQAVDATRNSVLLSQPAAVRERFKVPAVLVSFSSGNFAVKSSPPPPTLPYCCTLQLYLLVQSC